MMADEVWMREREKKVQTKNMSGMAGRFKMEHENEVRNKNP